SERRRFIDRAIFNAHPAFATECAHFEEVLKNRNALLKGDRVDQTLLGVYDEQFVEYGARLITRRLDFIEHFRPVLERTFRSIFDPDFEADVCYEMPWFEGQHGSQPDDIRRALTAALDATAREERDRGFTLIGPHRDDLLATLNGHDVKAFASQGQNRAFILAMKIAEITYLEERYHFAPILLLDDVSSELDRERNRHLFEFLKNRAQGQVFITTTHRDYILLDEDVRVFDVNEGAITCPS
ncbi:MAG: DNA replication/repair protein RecF, partial [Bradymonadaceae bacterium]